MPTSPLLPLRCFASNFPSHVDILGDALPASAQSLAVSLVLFSDFTFSGTAFWLSSLLCAFLFSSFYFLCLFCCCFYSFVRFVAGLCFLCFFFFVLLVLPAHTVHPVCVLLAGTASRFWHYGYPGCAYSHSRSSRVFTHTSLLSLSTIVPCMHRRDTISP